MADPPPRVAQRGSGAATRASHLAPRVESAAVTIKRRRRTVWEWVCKCARCEYEWTSQRVKKPTRCPRCQARNFDRPSRPYRRKPR
jgi:predicted Zn-ribbon and HTH transcriptional regulator